MVNVPGDQADPNSCSNPSEVVKVQTSALFWGFLWLVAAFWFGYHFSLLISCYSYNSWTQNRVVEECLDPDQTTNTKQTSSGHSLHASSLTSSSLVSSDAVTQVTFGWRLWTCWTQQTLDRDQCCWSCCVAEDIKCAECHYGDLACCNQAAEVCDDAGNLRDYRPGYNSMPTT